MASGGNNPPHEPTKESRRVVWVMSAIGNRRQEIALALGITQPTLRKHYKEELAAGHVQATANVASRLYAEAMKGNVRAIMFWLRCQAGWAERTELSGPDGGDIPIGEIRRRVVDPGPPVEDDDGGDGDE